MNKRFCGGVFFDPKIMMEMKINYPISLLYYLTKNENCFGIEIVKVQYKDNFTIDREVGNIVDISKDKDEVIAIIEILKQYYVTPISMKDIVEDITYEITSKNIQ